MCTGNTAANENVVSLEQLRDSIRDIAHMSPIRANAPFYLPDYREVIYNPNVFDELTQLGGGHFQPSTNARPINLLLFETPRWDLADSRRECSEPRCKRATNSEPPDTAKLTSPVAQIVGRNLPFRCLLRREPLRTAPPPPPLPAPTCFLSVLRVRPLRPCNLKTRIPGRCLHRPLFKFRQCGCSAKLFCFQNRRGGSRYTLSKVVYYF